MLNTFSLIVIVALSGFVGAATLPPPENRVYAREQKLLGPFKIDFDEALTCGQLIVANGFQYEKHVITSEDGYMLELYRIINPAARKVYGNQLVPVLLIHGIVLDCSSFMFNSKFEKHQQKRDYTFFGKSDKHDVPGPLLNRSSNDLAFVLATREFDVWLSNDRGTSYSRNHTHFDSFIDSEFWDFTWDKMGRYDLPANVDFVRKVTNHEKIVVVAYSQGTQQMLTHLAEDPSFADKLSLNVLVSPIAFLGDLPGLASVVPNERAFLHLISSYVGPLFPYQGEFDAGLTLLCTIPLVRPICQEIYFQIFGPDRAMFDFHHFPVLTSLLDTTAFKVLVHDLQSIHYGQMRYFDYGDAINLVLYGSRLPPRFPFENVPTYNLVLISGAIDYLAPPINVQRLRDILRGRPLVDHFITFAHWQHADFILGTNAFEYSHLPIVNIIREHVDTPYKKLENV